VTGSMVLLFEFIRNDVLDARDPTPGAVKGPLRFNDFVGIWRAPQARQAVFLRRPGVEEDSHVGQRGSKNPSDSAEINGDFSALLALPAPIQAFTCPASQP